MKILLVFGTRPEAIKMAPIVLLLKENALFDVKTCVTAQHRSLLDDVLETFNIVPDFDLNLMKKKQDLTDITVGVLEGLKEVFSKFKPNRVLVHGDTTTAFAASLAAFYCKIPVAHVEAGLRTNNIFSPWPEEANRTMIGRLADIHFAPTQSSYDNLVAENVLGNVYLTGNTVIDALQQSVSKINNSVKLVHSLEQRFIFLQKNKKIILVTGHRRENHGLGIINICNALKDLAMLDDVIIVYPVHPSPHIQKPVNDILSNNDNIYLLEPLDYLSFVSLLSKCLLVLTDSGGIQEEAPSLGKPVLVMREETERPEAITAGVAKLIGTNTQTMLNEVRKLLYNFDLYDKMAHQANPYGDGNSAMNIVNILIKEMCQDIR